MKYLGESSMLGKLLKNDLKKNMKLLLVLALATLTIAAITRGCKELGEDIAFFRILGIIFDSVYYALAVNVILQAFLRNFLNFKKSFYSDEAYLTHTLPVTKNQLINSKYITAIIEISLSFVCVIISLLIMFGSPTMFETLRLLLSTTIIGDFSTILVLSLVILLVIIEFLMFISIIFFSIVIGYRAKEKKVLKSFLLTAGMAFAAFMILAIIMIIILLINKISLTSTSLILSSSVLMSLIIAGIIVYSAVNILFYFLTQRAFSKGVNVD